MGMGIKVILQIDDDPEDCELFHETLKAISGADYHAIHDANKALTALRSGSLSPDLIFLDLNLPRKDGREVLAEIKSDAGLRRIPVIVLTTSEADRDVHRAYDLHANCYVRKPTDLDEYLSVIRACEKFWLHIVRLPG